ncbi:MAG TPA: glycosyltransferase [Tepidisphaeraceae bacterium]
MADPIYVRRARVVERSSWERIPGVSEQTLAAFGCGWMGENAAAAKPERIGRMAEVFTQRLMTYSKRVDLHCHSRASTEADEAVLQAIRCPESYSEPREIHAQAKQRGMDFVTITDHDSIAGVAELAGEADVLVGEEVTCYFPEDRCKIHLLVWGISQKDHDALQASANDIYGIARYVTQHRIAHAVAHPLYRQNGKLDRRHIERLLLLFKGFECLNGAHSMSHREVFEPLLDELDAKEIRRLERVHGLDALWPKPWVKARTGGSDDHGLFNIGRTWTEFPDDVETVEELLDCVRECRCRPGGEAGSSIKLAHNFLGVGMRYYTRQMARESFKSAVMRRLLGEKSSLKGSSLDRSLGRIRMASGAANLYIRSLAGKVGRSLGLKKPPRGTALLEQLMMASAMKRFDRKGPLGEALREGRSPIAEHQSMFDLLCGINRDVTGGIFDAVSKAAGDGQIGAIFDAFSTVIAQQATLLPYYFALFHQNQERDLLTKLAGRMRGMNGDGLRIGLFSDSVDESETAGRFAVDFARYAESRGMRLVLHCMSSQTGAMAKNIRNFEPLVSKRIEGFPVVVKIPPVLEILEWSDRQQFDVVLVNSCGPMAMSGWLVSKMLRAPLIAVCHADVAESVLLMSGGDYRISAAVKKYVAWLYRGAAKVLLGTEAGREAAAKISGLNIGSLVVGNEFESAWNACVNAVRGDSDQSSRTVVRPSVRDDEAMEVVAV